jgi:hypothetical protein
MIIIACSCLLRENCESQSTQRGFSFRMALCVAMANWITSGFQPRDYATAQRLWLLFVLFCV